MSPVKSGECSELLAVLVVLVAHHADGMHDHRIAAGEHEREEHLLFLLHVRFEFRLHAREEIGKAHRHRGMIGMHLLDANREIAQFRQFPAVDLMIALEDIADEVFHAIGNGDLLRR